MKSWSLQSNSFTRQVNLHRPKIGEKYQNSNATFGVIFKHCGIGRSFTSTIMHSSNSNSVIVTKPSNLTIGFNSWLDGCKQRLEYSKANEIVFCVSLFNHSNSWRPLKLQHKWSQEESGKKYISGYALKSLVSVKILVPQWLEIVQKNLIFSNTNSFE